MRTGILGGTFDPVHLGHLILAETAQEAAGLDRVLLIPTGCSYFKRDRDVTDPAIRLEMTRLAAEGNPHLEVSDVESKRPGNSYTCETLEELHRLYPEDTLFFIIGADTLFMMPLWKDPQRIFDLADILVETREDEIPEEKLKAQILLMEQQYQARIHPLPVRNIEISSTEIRERVRDGRSIRYLVPQAVEDKIREQGLYCR